MTTKDEALKLALNKAFQLGQRYLSLADSEYSSHWKKADAAKVEFEQLVQDTINAALAKQPTQQEPEAWVEGEEIYWNNAPDLNDWIRQNGQPLYTSPPAQRQACSADTWVGLTNEDINVLLGQFPHYSSEWDEFDFYVLARAIEAELKAKNFA